MKQMRKKTKELDQFLKKKINEASVILKNFENSLEKEIVYYTGQWQKDVLDNFTEKQSEKIFSEMRKYGNKYIFVQKKLPTFKDEDGLEWIGYDYIARRS